jgi:hypothetical protein
LTRLAQIAFEMTRIASFLLESGCKRRDTRVGSSVTNTADTLAGWSFKLAASICISWNVEFNWHVAPSPCRSPGTNLGFRDIPSAWKKGEKRLCTVTQDLRTKSTRKEKNSSPSRMCTSVRQEESEVKH